MNHYDPAYVKAVIAAKTEPEREKPVRRSSRLDRAKPRFPVGLENDPIPLAR
jgi:hypothetical protein